MNKIINLSKTIKTLEELILASSGADPFDEILKLIFIKLHSETTKQKDLSSKTQFIDAKKLWPGVFKKNEKIELPAKTLFLCISELEKINLFGTDLEIIDIAFEHLLPKKAKGSRGQYFTPRHVIDEMIKIINPKKGELILDPACGSGGFLLHAAKYIGNSKNIFGIDFDSQLLKIAKAMCLISGYMDIRIISANSLSDLNFLKPSVKKQFENNKFDIVMTNPPFGGEVRDREVLKNYELAKDNNDKIRNYTERHILFIERIIQFLKPGGRAAIVVPQGILNNTNLNYIRVWLYSKARILGVIGLDTNTFKPHTNVKTSLLFMQKWKDQPLSDYPVFMAVSQKSGKDISGNINYKTKNGNHVIDSDLPEITKMFRKFIINEGLDF